MTGIPLRTPAVPAPGPHGGDGHAVARALGLSEMLDLSLSLNPVAPDPVPVLERHLDAVGRYPSPGAATAALAEAVGVEPGRILLTNGGAEAIALVAEAMGGSVAEPEFSLLPRGHGPRWRSNPHNPSGQLAAGHETAAVWDESFYSLATGWWTRGDDAVVVGSLTKLLACPGLRIGYALGDPELIDRCRRRQPAWSVNGLAAAALPELLGAVDLARWAAAVAELRRELVEVLGRHGLTGPPSQANWVLVDRPGLRRLLAPEGVLVRDCASFGLRGFSRVAVPSAAGLEVLDAALSRLCDRGVLTGEKRDEDRLDDSVESDTENNGIESDKENREITVSATRGDPRR